MTRAFRIFVVLLCVAGIATASLAEQAEESAAGPAVPDYLPRYKDHEKFDWVKIKTGEWLKGEFTRMRNRTVYFDSDEFGDVDFDWSKVEHLYLPSIQSVKVGRRVYLGPLEKRGDKLVIWDATGVVEVPIQRVESVIPGGETELSLWSGKLTASYNDQRGNTEQTDLAAHLQIRRDQAVRRLITNYRGTYKSQDAQKAENNHRADFQWDHFVTERLFITLPGLDYLRDEFQNINDRVSPGVGIGYEFVKNARAEWDASIGPAYQYTNFDSGDPESDFAIVFSSMLDFDITGDIEFNSQYRLMVIATDIDKTSHFWDSSFSFDVWGPLELDVGFLFERIEDPTPRSGGEQPDSNDYTTYVGLTLNF